MAHKDPHLVLGVEPGATPEEIKAAWRTLARRHHPDLTGDDPEASQRATRRMAEINAAYAALTRGDGRRRGAPRSSSSGTARTNGAAGGSAQQEASPRRPHPGRTRPPRPVTGRLDTSDLFRPRNQTTSPPRARHPLPGQPPLRTDRTPADLRASTPTGPTEYDRSRDHVPPAPPSLDAALAHELDFGKFHGHTLGEVAGFEPSYIDWVASTVTRDPELAMAARVVRAELDRQGVRRPQRPARPGWRSNPFA